MKLIYCPWCHDVLKMTGPCDARPDYCDCGRSWGHYTDDLNAEYGGAAVPLGVSNSEFQRALLAQAEWGNRGDGHGHCFVAFIIPDNCDTCKQIKEPE